MIVVSDTSPLNYLILIGQQDVLPALFDRVVAPPAVLTEMQQRRAPEIVAKWAASPPVWLEVLAPTSVDAALNLGAGETEAIALAQELKADQLLMDERKASAVARRLGLVITGTLSVLSLAAEKNLLALPSAIAALRQTNFRGPVDLIEEMLKQDEARRASGKNPQRQ
jgi:predicted nucleic acid-binding protein